MTVVVISLPARRRLQEFFRVCFELRQTVMAAKIIALPVVNMTSGGFARLHLHAANRIDHYVTPLAYLASPIYSEGMCDSRSSRGELGRVEAQGCSRFNIPRSMFLFVSDFEH